MMLLYFITPALSIGKILIILFENPNSRLGCQFDRRGRDAVRHSSMQGLKGRLGQKDGLLTQKSGIMMHDEFLQYHTHDSPDPTNLFR